MTPATPPPVLTLHLAPTKLTVPKEETYFVLALLVSIAVWAALAVSIIGLVCALVPLLVWWLKRRAARADDPAVQNEARHVQAELDVWRHAGDSASQHGLADLDELDRLRRAKGDPK